eukprot:1557154-Amphidinium_carterae.1
MKSKAHSYGLCYAAVADSMGDLWERSWEASDGQHPFHAAEIGVLKGSGVAIWSDLFPRATIHALDRFRANLEDNTPFLTERGAFTNGMYEMHGFDQASLTHLEADRLVSKVGNNLFWIVDDASHRVDYTLR